MVLGVHMVGLCRRMAVFSSKVMSEWMYITKAQLKMKRFGFFHYIRLKNFKLGHVWFNTMFVCPGYCRTHYIHGDEEHPYPDELSSISERRPDCAQHRPKAGSASEPPTRPGEIFFFLGRANLKEKRSGLL